MRETRPSGLMQGRERVISLLPHSFLPTLPRFWVPTVTQGRAGVDPVISASRRKNPRLRSELSVQFAGMLWKPAS